MEEKKKKKKKKHRFLRHLKKIGFSNRLAVYILFFLLLGLIGGFYLALESIHADYLGSLVCWTVVFTPIGTAVSLAIGKVVDKSRAENTTGGIKYDLAINEQEQQFEEEFYDSPKI